MTDEASHVVNSGAPETRTPRAVNRLRSFARHPLAGWTSTLILVWIGVAIPILDRELVRSSVPALSSIDGALHGASHDHRLCLLLQSSHSLTTAGPEPLRGLAWEYTLSMAEATSPLVAGATSGPSARAPPFVS